MRRATWAGLGLIVLVVATTACGDDDDDDGGGGAGAIEVVEPWSRQPAAGQQIAAAYATVENGSDVPVRLVAATSDVTPDVELHETITAADGTMQMAEPDGGFEIPAGGELVLQPGGNHVMLLGIDAATYPTDTVEVTFEFEGADPITFDAIVRPIGADG